MTYFIGQLKNNKNLEMKKTILLSFFCFVTALTVCAQNEVNQELKLTQNTEQENAILSERWNKALGSFQFQIINSRINPQVPISTIDLIEANRLEDKVNYIDYRENIKIMILPKSQLKKEYQRLELFKYISTN